MQDYELLNPLDAFWMAYSELSILLSDPEASKVPPILSYSDKYQEGKYTYFINFDIYDRLKKSKNKYFRIRIPILQSNKPQKKVADKLAMIYFHTKNEFMETIKEAFAAERVKKIKIIDLDGKEFYILTGYKD